MMKPAMLCPFCGSTHISVIMENDVYAAGYCSECQAQGPMVPIGSVKLREIEDLAIAKWNERQVAQSVVE